MSETEIEKNSKTFKNLNRTLILKLKNARDLYGSEMLRLFNSLDKNIKKIILLYFILCYS